MMGELLSANYIADLKSIGRKDKMLSIVGKAGDNIFVGGSAKRCETHFEVLCGLRRPDVGEVNLCGVNPYEMTAAEAATFRRDNIGAVPHDLGLIPELRMIDQIALPMKLAGIDDETIITEIRKRTSELMPLHNLLNTPGKCNARKQAHAAMIRAVIRNPQIIVFNGFLDDVSDIDRDALWQAFHTIRPKNSVLIYLSGAPAPEAVNWTQQLRV